MSQYCKNIDHWPNTWEIETTNVDVGKALTTYFNAFLIKKIEQGREKKTIRNYAQYLWVLGGELIRQINMCEEDRKLSPKALLLNAIDEFGGPYWPHAYDESEHDRYDAVCKQLYKFMTHKG